MQNDQCTRFPARPMFRRILALTAPGPAQRGAVRVGGIARREDDGRWAVHVVRFGRLAAAGVIPSGADAVAYVEQLRAGAETVRTAPGPAPAATVEETEKILAWLEQPGIRLVDVLGEWVCPVAGATRELAVHERVRRSRDALAGTVSQ